MQTITEEYIDSLSDEDLKSLLGSCKAVYTARQSKKIYDERQIYCELYNDSWIKLKHKFYEGDNFENQYILVHIDKVLNIYRNVYRVSRDSDEVHIDATYYEQYYIDVLDEDDVDLRHIVANKDPNSISSITFELSDVIEFVKPECVSKIIDNVIEKFKR